MNTISKILTTTFLTAFLSSQAVSGFSLSSLDPSKLVKKGHKELIKRPAKKINNELNRTIVKARAILDKGHYEKKANNKVKGEFNKMINETKEEIKSKKDQNSANNADIDLDLKSLEARKKLYEGLRGVYTN